MPQASILKPLVLVVCFLFFCSCAPPPEPIKIGLTINLSGRGGEAGEHIRDGAMLAVEEINKRGGINGRPLELLVRDDQNSAEGIRQADLSLIENGVAAIIGHSYSTNTVKAYPIVTSRNTLLLTPYSATSQLSGKDDFFLRTTVDNVLFTSKTGVLLERQNASSVAVLMDMTNPAFVLDWFSNLKNHFSGTLFPVKFDSRDEADWPLIIAELLHPQPDAIVMLTEASMTGIALQKLRDKGYNGPRIGTTWTQAPGLFKFAGPAAEGFSIVTFIDPDNQRQEYLNFSRKMTTNFNKPANGRSVRAYEIVMILADALGRCREITTKELKQNLLSGQYRTLMGDVGFDRFGDVVRPVYEVVVHKGRFRTRGEI